MEFYFYSLISIIFSSFLARIIYTIKSIMSKVIQTHVLKEYEIKKEIGSGSYGYVWSVVSKKNQKPYALKKIYGAFMNNVDAQRTYRQIEVLLNLDSIHIIKLEKVIKSKGKNDIYLVFQLMESDLLSISNLQILQDSHKKFILYQILKGLDYLHGKQLIHRDLKPANILVNSSSEIKICDFGLVRSHTSGSNLDKKQANLTQQVATKWYRAPQLLLGSKSYGSQIDIWSFGCIAAQILLKRPILNGLSTEQIFHQMIEIDENLREQDLIALKIQGIEKLADHLPIKCKDLKKILGKKNLQYTELISRCMKINPQRRISIKQALQLPLFDQIRQLLKDYQSSTSPQQTKFCFSLDDNQRFQTQVYREKIYDLVVAKFMQNESQNSCYYKLQNNNSRKTQQTAKTRSQKFQNQSFHRAICISPYREDVFNDKIKRQHKHYKFKSSLPKNNQISTDSCRDLLNSLKKRDLSNQKPTKSIFTQKSQNLPYFWQQNIVKKPISKKSGIASNKVTMCQLAFEKAFLNKFCENSRQKLVTQTSQSYKQLQKEKKLIQKYSMHITSSIYRCAGILNGRKNQAQIFHINKKC